MQRLLQLRVHSLQIAATRINQREIAKFGQLKRLYAAPQSRLEFENLFKTHYGLNSAGLTDQQKEKIFEFVYAPWNISDDTEYEERFIEIVTTIYDMNNLKGRKSIQASFATKILAFKNDIFPIFDRHVGNFFGITMSRDIPLPLRLHIFCGNLREVRHQYESLAHHPEVKAVLGELRKNPIIADCSPIRVLDFLVFTAGTTNAYDVIWKSSAHRDAW